MVHNIVVSLIIPCYNEETNIQKGVLDKIGNYTKDNNFFGEVLIVDDGSDDKSKSIIKEKYISRFPKFKLIEIKHLGKAFAVITGIQKAKEPYVMFSDIDLASPIEEADLFIQYAQKGYQILIGSRNTHREGAPFLRKAMAIGFIVIRNLIIGLRGIRDTQCGFKMFEKKAAEHIIRNLKVFEHKKEIKGSSVNAAFDLEFLFLAKKMGYFIKEIPVVWKHVETKNVNFLRDSVEAFKDILRIRYYHMGNKK